MKQFLLQALTILGTTLTVTISSVCNVPEIAAQKISDNIQASISNSTFVEQISWMNDVAIDSLKQIDSVTGDNLTEEYKKLACTAVDEFNNKIKQVQDGTYDADAEMKMIQNAATDAIKSIDESGYGLSDEEKAEMKQTIKDTAEETIKKVKKGEITVEDIEKIGDESLETINKAGKESIESINNSMSNVENKEIQKTFDTIKEKTNEIKNKITK